METDVKQQLSTVAATVTDDEATVTKYTEHLAELFDALTPQRICSEFEDAMNAGDICKAVHVLATYYRNKPSPKLYELCANGNYDRTTADNAKAGIAREVNIDWTFPGGEVDFLFDPTEIKGPRNHEWLWQFNRHSYWSHMARAYTATHDESYAVSFRSQLLKWIAQTYIPEHWNAPGSAWRTIECGIRLLGTWQISFDGFRRSESIEDVTLLLMIASMHRQSVHLAAHPTTRNWLMMEMNGVYTFSALFPELADSESNRRLATELLVTELENQILPDGMHCELSPDYQSVVLSCAKNFYRIAAELGYKNDIPKNFEEALKNTVNAAVLLSTPALTQPRTNDTYTIPTDRFTLMAEQLFGKTPVYDFINSKRARGQAPNGATASAFLPYAGFAAMRSDWGADATYLCFDVGPLGCAHVHQDKLNINIYKGNEELLFDDGGGQYEISRTRDYSLSAYGHNTVLVDGEAQRRSSPDRVYEPIDAGWITNEVFDHACAVYDDTFGADKKRPAIHKREVRFCRPDLFCVSDTLTSLDGKEHDYELLFQLDTTKVKKLDCYKNALISEYGRRYELLIVPIDCDCAEVELSAASAVTEPRLKGWYSGRNESKLHEATTVSRTVKNVKDFRFNTLLFPISADDALPSVTVKDGVVDITFKNKHHTFSLDALDK